ncbi:MAG TPA: helix-turn-helix domain-containing protein [Terriglobia bacterium]|nr:helix-turn-helix domain-containing protein [Terriglobia bacterium]
MLSPDDAMQLLQMRLGILVGRSTFYRWVYSGRLFSVKLGGKLFIPLSEMEVLMQRLARGDRL